MPVHCIYIEFRGLQLYNYFQREWQKTLEYIFRVGLQSSNQLIWKLFLQFTEPVRYLMWDHFKKNTAGVYGAKLLFICYGPNKIDIRMYELDSCWFPCDSLLPARLWSQQGDC